MPFKDEAERKEYNREQMRQRRARAKEQKAAEGHASASGESGDKGRDLQGAPPRYLSPPKDEVTPPSAPPLKIEPGPAIPASGTKSDKMSPEFELEFIPTSSPKEFRLIRRAEFQNPQEVVYETEERLQTKGWVLWECSNLGKQPVIIVIVRDESITGFPPGYPVYTRDELIALGEADAKDLAYIHRAKVISQGKLFI